MWWSALMTETHLRSFYPPPKSQRLTPAETGSPKKEPDTKVRRRRWEMEKIETGQQPATPVSVDCRILLISLFQEISSQKVCFHLRDKIYVKIWTYFDARPHSRPFSRQEKMDSKKMREQAFQALEALRRESSCSISASSEENSEWAGGLRSCASESSSEPRKGKGKGKGKGKVWLERAESESDSEMTEHEGAVTTSLEVPLRVLRTSWKAPLAASSTARIEVDASRRDGFGRITIIGSWRQSLLAYQCLMQLFHKVCNNEALMPPGPQNPQGPRVWRTKTVSQNQNGFGTPLRDPPEKRKKPEWKSCLSTKWRRLRGSNGDSASSNSWLVSKSWDLGPLLCKGPQ